MKVAPRLSGHHCLTPEAKGRGRWADLLRAAPASPLPAPAERPLDRAEPIAAVGPTGPELLAYAARLLPEVTSPLPRYSEVHALLFEALCLLGAGTDRHHRLRLCDEACDMLAAYLVVAGVARPAARTSTTVRNWLFGTDQATLRAALTGAARYWERELRPSRADKHACRAAGRRVR